MRSVPPRGSGWAVYIANCRFPIANWSVPQLAIGNRHLAIGNLETHPLPRLCENSGAFAKDIRVDQGESFGKQRGVKGLDLKTNAKQEVKKK